MTTDKLVILVTGAVASGKTTFLTRLYQSTQKWWRACGFVSQGDGRKPPSKGPAASYRLMVMGSSDEWPWAARHADGSGFKFCDATSVKLTEIMRAPLDSGDADFCFLDEIGGLELKGQGIAELFRLALASRCRIVVAAVKKRVLVEVIETFKVTAPVVIDLDDVGAKQGLRDAKRCIAACDAERIGAFAGIAGLVEVGLGSTLHAYKAPFRGHLLAYLQNLMLITFGKALKGRGLVRIAFVSAMLKVFSPIGSTFGPMAYIFLQGLFFAAPVRLIGWNLGSVLSGSVLMGWLTLVLSLAKDYVTFGKSIFDAFLGAIAFASGWLGIGSPSLIQVIGGVFVLKALLALMIGVGAYFGNMQPLVRRLKRLKVHQGPAACADHHRDHTGRSIAGTVLLALSDLVRPRFAIIFILSVLLLLFFANLSRADFLIVVVRGLCISYLSFLVMRNINTRSVGSWLDRHAGMGLGKSLPIALDVLGRPPEALKDPVPDVTAPPGSTVDGPGLPDV